MAIALSLIGFLCVVLYSMLGLLCLDMLADFFKSCMKMEQELARAWATIACIIWPIPLALFCVMLLAVVIIAPPRAIYNAIRVILKRKTMA